MPELPEVETIRAGLEDSVAGRVLKKVYQRRPDLRIPFPPRFADRLENLRLERVDRRGKYLLWRFSDGTVLIVHLGMSGQIIRRADTDSTVRPHEHVALGFVGGDAIIYRDPRRFGLMTLTDEVGLATHPLLRNMGPEPLSPEFNVSALARALHGRNAPVKSLLLDQRVVAGIGNIYACEALHRAGIDPTCPAGSITGSRIKRLTAAVQDVLKDAIAAGGSSLRDYVQASGESGYFQHEWRVYGREGKSCGFCRAGGRCRVQRMILGGRSTFWCPRRQR